MIHLVVACAPAPLSDRITAQVFTLALALLVALAIIEFLGRPVAAGPAPLPARERS